MNFGKYIRVCVFGGVMVVFGCATPEETKLETNDTGLDTGAVSEDSDSDDSGSEDTTLVDTGTQTEEGIVAKEGWWDVRGVQLIEDVCGLSQFQSDITSFVPSKFQVSNATETGFDLDPQTHCSVNDNQEILCDVQTIEQEAMPGAMLIINNRFQGELQAFNDISVDFDIQIECDGWGCAVMDLAPNVDFPCAMVLYANAQPQ